MHRRAGKRRQTLQSIKFGQSDVNEMFKKAAQAHKLDASKYLSPETNRLVANLYYPKGGKARLSSARYCETEDNSEFFSPPLSGGLRSIKK